MSTAKPMGDDRREASYGKGWAVMTPRQYRRFIKKMRHAQAPFSAVWPVNGKRHATPRQRKRRPGQ